MEVLKRNERRYSFPFSFFLLLELSSSKLIRWGAKQVGTSWPAPGHSSRWEHPPRSPTWVWLSSWWGLGQQPPLDGASGREVGEHQEGECQVADVLVFVQCPLPQTGRKGMSGPKGAVPWKQESQVCPSCGQHRWSLARVSPGPQGTCFTNSGQPEW